MDENEDVHLQAIDDVLCQARKDSDVERIDALELMRSLVARRSRRDPLSANDGDKRLG